MWLKGGVLSMREIQRRVEDIRKVTLTEETVKTEPVSPTEQRQAIPEDVKTVNGRGVVHEDFLYQPPTPIFSARGRGRTW